MNIKKSYFVFSLSIVLYHKTNFTFIGSKVFKSRSLFPNALEPSTSSNHTDTTEIKQIK